MKTYTFEGTATALTSIAHNGGQSYGINQKLRREKVVAADGMSVDEIPVISGNAFRGVLRDLAMLDLCRSLGYGEPGDDGKPRGLSLAAFYLLFSGGSLTSVPNGVLSIEDARRARTLIPLLGVFGGALGNQILPGCLKVGKLIPLCRETAHLVPGQFANRSVSVWDLCQEEMYTRRDDERSDRLRTVLNAGACSADSAPQQMMYYIETLAAGTRFYLRFDIDDPTENELGAFGYAMLAFSRAPFLGGRSAAGMGRLELAWDVVGQGAGDGELFLGKLKAYEAHRRERATEIREWLQAIR